jgi:hypothetical protein
MVSQHNSHATPSGRASPADIQRYLLQARRMRAQAFADAFRWLGRRLRAALLRQRERRAVIAELQSYSDAELQRDLLIPRAAVARIAGEEADRRVRQRLAAEPTYRKAA